MRVCPLSFLINARNRSAIGEAGERQAVDFLKKSGLTWIASRFRSRFGEIDLIMRDHHTIVFIEVRLRKTNHRGSGAESVDSRKQDKLIKTALIYLQKERIFEKKPCRFDVIDISQEGLKWIKNAF